MTINDKHYNDISEKVYWLDPKYPRYNEGYKRTLLKNLLVWNFKSYKSKTHWTACRRCL